MIDVSTESTSNRDTIYWDDLDEKKKTILDIFERSPNPILWTHELNDEVEFTKPTLLSHLGQLVDMGVVGKKENVDIVWWLVDDVDIRPGSRDGVAAKLHRWFPTSTQSSVDRWVNAITLTGGGLALFGMFLIIVAFYIRTGDTSPPVVLGLSMFAWGLLSGVFGFLMMSVKLGSFLGEVVGRRLESHWAQSR